MKTKKIEKRKILISDHLSLKVETKGIGWKSLHRLSRYLTMSLTTLLVTALSLYIGVSPLSFYFFGFVDQFCHYNFNGDTF